MRHNISLVNLLEKRLHQLPTSKMMKISKCAPNLVKMAVTSFKSKMGALRKKLIIMASLRRRMSMVCAMSRQIHRLVASGVSRDRQAMVEQNTNALCTRQRQRRAKSLPVCLRWQCMRKVTMTTLNGPTPSSTMTNCYNDEDVQDDEDDYLDVDDFDEPSVIEIIRSSREAEGLEFNMEDDIDEACDMFIRRRRSRMNLSF
ncbi:unnamed protein product [Urochloa decumbens]|uniref:Uncharacterized protein n=1 Tax=Urochloa decumbens TaxID=240449 RepID=A0ABC9G640_9POAL